MGDESPGSGITSVWSFCSCIFRRFFSLVFLNRLSLSSSESTHEGFMPAVRHFSSRHFWQFFLDLSVMSQPPCLLHTYFTSAWFWMERRKKARHEKQVTDP